MLDRLKRFRIPLLIVLALLVIGGIVFELMFQVIRTAPPVDRAELMEHPVIQIVVTPEHAPDFLHRYAEKKADRSIPRWAFDRFMARELGALISGDAGDEMIRVYNYASLPHAAGFAAGQANQRGVQERVAEIEWTEAGVHRPRAGVIALEGAVEGDREALEAVFFQWGDGRSIAPLTATGDHLFEIVFDNRNGQAYLAMASIMAAFDFELNPNDTDITLSSFQFVITARIFVDVVEGDVFEIAMDFEIEPAARNRIGVINLKGGIDELFSEVGEDLKRDRGITISGDSDWNENVIEYRYRIEPASDFLDAMAERD